MENQEFEKTRKIYKIISLQTKVKAFNDPKYYWKLLSILLQIITWIKSYQTLGIKNKIKAYYQKKNIFFNFRLCFCKSYLLV